MMLCVCGFTESHGGALSESEPRRSGRALKEIAMLIVLQDPSDVPIISPKAFRRCFLQLSIQDLNGRLGFCSPVTRQLPYALLDERSLSFRMK